MARIGKELSGVRYVHCSVLKDYTQFSPVETELLTRARYMVGKSVPPGHYIVAINRAKSLVTYTACPDWDILPEPSLGDSIVVNCITLEVSTRRAPLTNPYIIHRRHLYVSPKYQGFDVAEDVARVLSWSKLNPDKAKMARRLWWDNFCEQHHI